MPQAVTRGLAGPVPRRLGCLFWGPALRLAPNVSFSRCPVRLVHRAWAARPRGCRRDAAGAAGAFSDAPPTWYWKGKDMSNSRFLRETSHCGGALGDSSQCSSKTINKFASCSHILARQGRGRPALSLLPSALLGPPTSPMPR